MYGKCKKCGCTDNHACNHPDYGSCWWVTEEHDLCSHCADESYPDSVAALIKIPEAEID